MVCVPCFALPVFLIIWRYVIQPLLIKWWQLWNQEKEAKGDQACPDLVKECKNGTCTLSWKDNAKKSEDNVKKSEDNVKKSE